MTAVTRELNAAVDRLYNAFATVPRNEQIGYCDHCVSPEEAQTLVTTPLREIGPDLMRHFMSDAKAETWGDWDDLHYYLPRVLEFIALGEFSSIAITGLFFGIGLRWRRWPEEQQRAISGYLMALWPLAVTRKPKPFAVGAIEVLNAAGDLGLSVDPFLRDWEARTDQDAARSLAYVISHDAYLWQSHPGQSWSQAFDQWVKGSAARRVLSACLAAPTTPEIVAEAALALAVLDSWQQPS